MMSRRRKYKMSQNIEKEWSHGTTCYYQPAVVGNGVLCIFERPTTSEVQVGRPVVGDTGEHLCMLCEYMRNVDDGIMVSDINDFCSRRMGILNVSTLPLCDDPLADGKDASGLNDCQIGEYRRMFEQRCDVKDAIAKANCILCFGGLAAAMMNTIEKLLDGRDVKRIISYHLSGSATPWFSGESWDEKMRRLSVDIYTALSSASLVVDLRKGARS